MFLFPDANRELYPGVFRAEALRAVYVDWKAGGQVNYFKDFGEQWWSRWQAVMAKPFQPADCAKFAVLGIDYIVVKPEHKLPGRIPAFENSQFIVYSILPSKTVGQPIVAAAAFRGGSLPPRHSAVTARLVQPQCSSSFAAYRSYLRARAASRSCSRGSR